MKKPFEATHQAPQESATKSSAHIGGQAAAGRTQGTLGRLATTINASPLVQTQLKLASQMNHGTAVQRAGGPKDKEKQAPRKDDKKKERKMKKADPSKPQNPAAQRMPAQLEAAPAPNQTGMPDGLKAGVESLSGVSLDDVKVHYNSARPAQLNALAYAQGTDIHVAAGQEQHLAHEAWHVVQQKQGRVQPTTQMKAGVPVNDDPQLEREADVMGAKALQRVEDGSAGADRPRREAEDHAEGCSCPGCCQAKSAVATVSALQRMSDPIQMVCKECGRKPHKSDCSRNPHNRGAKAKKDKVVHEENQSWKNMKCYRPGWVRDNDITEENVKDFCKQYEQRKIRGHCSEDKSHEEHKNTTTDLNAYKSWHSDNVKAWV